MLAAQNAALAERAGELEKRLARLEHAASRNSGNSSLPPSLDDQPGRTPPCGCRELIRPGGSYRGTKWPCSGSGGWLVAAGRSCLLRQDGRLCCSGWFI